MPRTVAPQLYADSAYDQYLCLKPSPLLWLAALFISREVTLPLLMGISQVAGVNADALAMVRKFWNFNASLLPALLGALLLFTFFRRTPQAPRQVRWVWHHGVQLLFTAAAADFLLALFAVWNEGVSAQSAVAIPVDLLLLGYVFCSRRVRDTFADFPPYERRKR